MVDDLNDRKVTTFEVRFEVCDAGTVLMSASRAPSVMDDM
jgi:hypothetical protein